MFTSPRRTASTGAGPHLYMPVGYQKRVWLGLLKCQLSCRMPIIILTVLEIECLVPVQVDKKRKL